MLLFLAVIALSYYLLLSLIKNSVTAIIILFVVIPLFCLVLSIIYGLNNPLSISYIVLVAILFIPSVFVIFYLPVWILASGYGIVALIGNAVGRMLFKRNVK